MLDCQDAEALVRAIEVEQASEVGTNCATPSGGGVQTADNPTGKAGCRAGSARLSSSWLVMVTSWLGSAHYQTELKVRLGSARLAARASSFGL